MMRLGVTYCNRPLRRKAKRGLIGRPKCWMTGSSRESKMLDDRIIQAHNFVNDDAFIKIEEFKNLLFKVKQNELSL